MVLPEHCTSGLSQCSARFFPWALFLYKGIPPENRSHGYLAPWNGQLRGLKTIDCVIAVSKRETTVLVVKALY